MPCSPHRRAECFVTQIMIGVDFLPDWSRKQCFTLLLKTIWRSLRIIRKAKSIRWCICKAKSNKINTTEYFLACIHSYFFFFCYFNLVLSSWTQVFSNNCTTEQTKHLRKHIISFDSQSKIALWEEIPQYQEQIRFNTLYPPFKFYNSAKKRNKTLSVPFSWSTAWPYSRCLSHHTEQHHSRSRFLQTGQRHLRHLLPHSEQPRLWRPTPHSELQ